MISPIIIPSLGATGGDVTIVEWLVEEGDFVKAGAPLFVVETDKATDDIEAFRDGFVRQILVPADTAVELGSTVAMMADTLDEPIELPAEQTAALEAAKSPAGPRQPPLPPHSAPNTSAARSSRILVSPLARRLAVEHGIDLVTVQGSGLCGEIHQRDILAAVGDSIDDPNCVRREPLSSARRAIAERTLRSKTEIPHYYVSVEVDMTAVVQLRRHLAETARAEGKTGPSLTDLILRGTALALRETPRLNATFHETEIHYYEEIHLGLVVGMDQGIVVPVIRNADRQDLWTLAATTRRLSSRAAAGELSRAEMSGGAMSISNLGMYGVDRFVAVINPPQSAMLACGAARPKAVVHEDRIAIRTMMDVTLSVDHRVADGIEAARFLKALKRYLEQSQLLSNDPPDSENQ